MFKRNIQRHIQAAQAQYRGIALTGPRQSGKTTLAKMCFPKHVYHSLENPDTRQRAVDDPRGFLASIRGSAILDEIQYAPELFSYLQEILDDKTDPRSFVLTGSNSFQIHEKIAQSLAGRVRTFHIHPMLRGELPEELRPAELVQMLFTGLYPRIYDEGLKPNIWYGDYYNTYIQKDLRLVSNVSNLANFDRFVRVCAGQSARLTRLNRIASDVGVTQPTAQRWLTILEASFICFRLQPHFRNFKKRIIKAPKLYFWDTGLLCYLLRIRSPQDLETHPLRGEIFENWVIAEMFKTYSARGIEAPLYYWRDQHGHEVDLLCDRSTHFLPVEIKSGQTFQSQWLKNLEWLNALQERTASYLVYGGDEDFIHRNTQVLSWRHTDALFEQFER